MEDQTNWTPGSDDNKLGLTDKDLINKLEAEGLVNAELFVLDLDESVEISASLILEIHRIAFATLYDWAGKLRQGGCSGWEAGSPKTYPRANAHVPVH